MERGGPGLPQHPFLKEEEDLLRVSLSRLPSGSLPSHRRRMLILSSLTLEEPQCSGPLVQSFISTSRQQIYWFSCEFSILLTNPQSPSRMNSTIFVLTALVMDILSVGHLPQHCCRRVWSLCRLWEIRLSPQQTTMSTLNTTHPSPRQQVIPGTLATPAPQLSLHGISPPTL